MATKRQIAEQVRRILAGGTPGKDFPIDEREVMYALEQERDTMITQYLNNKFAIGDHHIEGHFLNEDVLTVNLHPDHAPAALQVVDINGFPTQIVGFDDLGEPIPATSAAIHSAENNFEETDVYGDTTRLPFVRLKRTPITLTDNRGIYQVRKDTASHQFGYTFDDEGNAINPSRPFLPMGLHTNSLHWNMPSRFMSGREGYYIQGKSIFLVSQDPEVLYSQNTIIDDPNTYVATKIRVVYVAATRDIKDDENMPLPADMESTLIKALVQTFGVMIGRPEDYVNDNIKA